MEIKIYKFKDLSKSQLYEIMKLRQKIFIIEQECFYNDFDEKDKDSYHILLMKNNEIISYARIINENQIKIGRVLTKKEYRNLGLATKTINAAIDFINDKLKEKTIIISAQLYLKDYYSKFGFIAISDIYLEDNIKHIRMEKRLD